MVLCWMGSLKFFKNMGLGKIGPLRSGNIRDQRYLGLIRTDPFITFYSRFRKNHTAKTLMGVYV